jgi:hypothetical protein
MYINNELFNQLICLIYTTPYENIDWNSIKSVIQHITEIPEFYLILYNIYTASIYTNILYLYKNNIYVGCPGNYAKSFVSFLGMPSFMNKVILNKFIHTAIYGCSYCKCNFPYCEFKEEMIISLR